MHKTTLLFLRKLEEKQVLLAMKKRKFGQGKWNGVGGKLEADESFAECAIREAEEEIGVVVREGSLIHMATLKFVYTDVPDWSNECHVFVAEQWQGKPTETEEVKPMWYSESALPFDDMWVDDPHWLPRVLAGEGLSCYFTFDERGEKLLDIDIKELSS